MTNRSDQQQTSVIVPIRARPERIAQMFGIGKGTLLRWEKEFDDFPKPSRPNPRVTLYDVDAIAAFLTSRQSAPGKSEARAA
jgi:hypothetical protein